MSDANLSLAQTPPLQVPLIFMLTAPLFSAAAGLVVFCYPEAMQSRWTPEVLSVTHLLVLGFAVMVMFGAVQQLLPVLAGVSLSRPVAISVSIYAGFTSGVLCLCLGLVISNQLLLIIAALCLTLTVASFLILVGSALLRSKANPRSIRGIQFALFAFLITVALGLYLGAGHTSLINLQRQYTQLHLVWGLLGWIALLIISVSYQVVPMFQITPRYPDRMLRWLVPGTFFVMLLWSFLKLVQLNGLLIGQWVSVTLELLITASLTIFCLETFYLQARRKRKLPDVTLNFFRVGLGAMLAALVTWWIPASIAGRWISVELLTGLLLIVGFAMSIITGMLYKIVPFLVWLHLTNEIDMSNRWAMNIPNMKQIIPDRHSRWQLRLHCLMLALMIAALCQVPWIIQVAAICLVLSSLYLFRNLISAVLLYHKIRSQVSIAKLQPSGDS